VKDDMRIKGGVSILMTSDRRDWKKNYVVPTPLSGIRLRFHQRCAMEMCRARVSSCAVNICGCFYERCATKMCLRGCVAKL
jgi:hypothetical protein